MAESDVEIDQKAAASEFYSAVGARLREFRENNGITQEEMRDVFNVGQTAVSQIENGKRHLSLFNAKKFCMKYGLYMNDLVGFENGPIDFSQDPDLHHLLSDTLQLPEPHKSIFKRTWREYLDVVQEQIEKER